MVYPAVIQARLASELPFMATENIMMAMVRKGADRQEIHEAIRVHSQEAARNVKERGGANDLIDRLKSDPAFAPIHHELDDILDPAAFVGRAPEQVAKFIQREVRPALADWKEELGKSSQLKV